MIEIKNINGDVIYTHEGANLKGAKANPNRSGPHQGTERRLLCRSGKLNKARTTKECVIFNI